MRDATLAAARLHARLPVHGRRVARARAAITDWLGRCQRPYIALSGGKDSTVVLDLVRSECADVPAVWSDDQFHYPETLAYLDTVHGLIRVATRSWHHEWFTAWDSDTRPVDLPEDRLWLSPLDGGFDAWAFSHYDGVALGLRAAENRYRRIGLAARGRVHRARTRGDLWQCNPLADWTVMDVWAYILSRGVRYNAAYDRMDEAEIPLDDQRVGPLLNWRADGYKAMLQTLRELWPSVYHDFRQRFPQTHQLG